MIFSQSGMLTIIGFYGKPENRENSIYTLDDRG